MEPSRPILSPIARFSEPVVVCCFPLRHEIIYVPILGANRSRTCGGAKQKLIEKWGNKTNTERTHVRNL